MNPAKDIETKNLLSTVESHGKKVERLEESFKRVDRLQVGIMVVFFLAFVSVVFALGTILVDSFRSKENSYSDLVRAIDRQNNIIEKQNSSINSLLEKLSKK